MEPVRHRATFAASPEAVWDVLEDLDRIPAWVSGVTRVQPVAGAIRVTPGTRFTQRLRQGLFAVECEGMVTALERPDRVELEVTHPHLVLRVEYRFAPARTATQVDARLDLVRSDLPPAILATMVRLPAALLVERQVAALQRLVEGAA